MTNEASGKPGFNLTPEQFRALWVEELRSGKWKQGGAALARHGDTFCCLGVACELYIREGGKLDKRIGGSIVYNDSRGYLPHIVRDALGLKTDDGVLIRKYRRCDTLASCNDYGCKFTTIANLIERGYVELFTGDDND